jgi:hypothetical protein
LKGLLDLSESIEPHAWLLFLDNDDLYLPERVGFFLTNGHGSIIWIHHLKRFKVAESSLLIVRRLERM